MGVRMEQAVFASVTYSAMCPDCGAATECHGVQSLADGRVRWDVESTCSSCGFALALCGGDMPSERREQLLAEHGPVTLRVLGASSNNVVIMRVLRAELGIDLAATRAVLHSVLSGDCSGTLPEMEHMARTLRASGITAVATRA
ncbi:hypothetical protein AB0D09_13620 [Streptomyces sp. NPDC049097]|uniref:hypothetical protein n=1 Tax=unclassified Streptomyces TaxID=2593676 RepID=UPI0034005ECE